MDNDNDIKWADYCRYWDKQFCILKCDRCPWTDLGGYPIMEKCQFYQEVQKT